MSFDVSWIFEAQDAFSPVAKKVQQSAVRLGKSIENVSKQTIKFGKQASRMGRGISMKLGVPLTALAALSVKSASKFDLSMRLMRDRINGTTEDMAKLKKQAMALGATPPFNYMEVGAQQMAMASVGIRDVNKVLAVTPTALQYATATGTDFNTTAQITQDLLTGFNDTIPQYNKDMQELAQANVIAGISGTDFAASMKYVGAISKSVGWTLKDDLLPAFAAAAKAGIPTSEFSMEMSTVLTKLTNLTPKLTKTLKHHGIALFDIHGHLKHVVPLMDQFVKLQEKSVTKPQKKAFGKLLATLFGQRGEKAALALIQQIKVMKSYRAEAARTGNVMKKLADEQMKGLSGALNKLGGAFEEVQNAFVSPQAQSAIMLYTNKLSTWLLTLRDASPATKLFVDKMTLLGIALGPAVIALGKLIIMLGLFARYSGLIKIFVALGLEMTMALGIGIALFTILYKKSEMFRRSIKGIITDLKNVAAPFLNFWKLSTGAKIQSVLKMPLAMMGGGLKPSAAEGQASLTAKPLSMQQQVMHYVHVAIKDTSDVVKSVSSSDKGTTVSKNSTGQNMAMSRVY